MTVFADVDEFDIASRLNFVVDVSDGVDADNLRPVVDFFQSAAESRSVFEIRNLAFGFTPRILEQEARGVEAKLVFGEIARARDHDRRRHDFRNYLLYPSQWVR